MLRSFVKTAAAVGALMMCSVAAEASTILYEDASVIPQTNRMSQALRIDVDQDGIDDLAFREVRAGFRSYTGAYGLNGAQIYSGAALQEGDRVTSGTADSTSLALTGYFNRFGQRTFGEWDDGTLDTRTGYLGFELSSGALGWLELTLNPVGSASGEVPVLASFAYETEPGQSIVVGPQVEIIPNPLPASGWMILAGLAGLGLMKRRNKG